MSLSGLRSRTKGLDLVVVILLLIVSAVLMRSFVTTAPTAPTATPISLPLTAEALRRNLQIATERYYETGGVTVKLAALATTQPVPIEATVSLDVPRNGRPPHWIYRILRFVASRHTDLSLQRLSVVDTKDSRVLYDMPDSPPTVAGPATDPRGPRRHRGQTKEEYERDQSQRLASAGQAELERLLGSGQGLVLVQVNAAVSARPLPRRSRVAPREPIVSYQIGQVHIYIVFSGTHTDVEKVVQGAVEFDASRGDTYKELVLTP